MFLLVSSFEEKLKNQTRKSLKTNLFDFASIYFRDLISNLRTLEKQIGLRLATE